MVIELHRHVLYDLHQINVKRLQRLFQALRFVLLLVVHFKTVLFQTLTPLYIILGYLPINAVNIFIALAIK